jgi:hypothetical protein
MDGDPWHTGVAVFLCLPAEELVSQLVEGHSAGTSRIG